MFRKIWLALGLALLACPLTAMAQDPPAVDNPIETAFTSMGVNPATIMTQGMTSYGALLVLGVSFIIAVSLVWTIVYWLKRGTNTR